MSSTVTLWGDGSDSDAPAADAAHVVVRNHSPAFWRVVGDLLPDWRERQRWLDRYERRLEL